MNPIQEIHYGVSISSQNITPKKGDFELRDHYLNILNSYPRKEALQIILNDDFEGLQSPLSDMGLNPQALKNIITGFIKDGKEVEAEKILRDVIDVYAWGIDNEVVQEKFINLLKLFGFKILRFSIDWSKAIDDQGRPNLIEIAKYKEFCEKLLSEDVNIQPIITISHFETAGYDIFSEEFESIFNKLSQLLLEELIPIGVKYFLAFNEPAVHSGGINLGFWGYNSFTKHDAKMSLNPIKTVKAIKTLTSQATNHYKFLKRIGDLSKTFYLNAKAIAEEKDTNVEILANFNFSVFFKGSNPNPIDSLITYLANKVDKDLQINAYNLGPDENGNMKRAFDILAINPYQVYDFALTNKLIRKALSKLFDEDILLKYFPDTSNKKLINPDLTKVGTHGQLLTPHAVAQAIKQMAEEHGFSKIVLTETGSDTNGEDPEGLKNKLWYLLEVIMELEILNDGKLSIPFALIWTLVQMWEILGPPGGGGGLWDFAILGKPLRAKEISIEIQNELNIKEEQANELAKQISHSGDVPLRIYDGMIEKLGIIFRGRRVEPDEMVESLMIKNKYNLVVDIIQITELRKYYEKQLDKISVDYLTEVLDILKNEYLLPVEA